MNDESVKWDVPFRMSRLGDTFGVEIHGVQIERPLSAPLLEGIKQVLAQYSVILFRGATLSEAQQGAFTEQFGPHPDRQEHVWAPNVDLAAEPGKPTHWEGRGTGFYPLLNKGNTIFFVNGPGLADKKVDRFAAWDNEDDSKAYGASCWHTGDTEEFDTEYVSTLYAEVAATEGGNTLWSDNTTAFEDLPEQTRRRMEGLRAIHYFTYREGTSPVSQPLVKTHPITGRKAFYMNFFTVERIERMERRESYDTLKFLYEHLCQPRYVYRQVWRDGDMIMWNNNTTMHRKGRLVSGIRRIMRRTQARVPEFQSKLPWDKTRPAENHDGGHWFPYPFEERPA